MSLLPFPHRHLFRRADVADKMAFFQSLLDSGELTPDLARALLHEIHTDLVNQQRDVQALYRRCAALKESMRVRMPNVYQQVLGNQGAEAVIQGREGKDLPGSSPEVKSASPFFRVAKYVLSRLLAIFTTILIGVFVAVVLANRGGQVDNAVRQDVTSEIDRRYPGWRWNFVSPEGINFIAMLQSELEDAAGVNLPFWPRHLRWTLRALALDWREGVNVQPAPGSFYSNHEVKEIILTDFPHTLLLIGAAFLLLFLFGIPLALFLFRKPGNFFDRLMIMLAPISSIPSWVLGLLLILIFAVTLRLLPIEGMYDILPGESRWDKTLIVLRHMVLPVLAILLSLFFQCVYSWRSFLLLYSEEDYVELATAKGLPDRVIGRQYILMPTLVYLLTSFALLLTSFWQMTMALEKVINWPGIGRLFIITLPNFLGESFYPGIMQVTLSIVVLFAYLMGLTVFLLDITYALVDPRVRIGDEQQTVSEVAVKARKRFRWGLHRAKRQTRRTAWAREADQSPAAFAPEPKTAPGARRKALKKWLESLRPTVREIVRYPSAVFGLVVILLMVAGSIYAVTAFPYAQMGHFWYTKMLTGKVYTPKFAQPEWVNWLRRDKLPATIIQNSQNGGVTKTLQSDPSGLDTITLTYTFDYPYASFPQDIFIYVDPKYDVKRPFASLTWITPDGQQFELGNMPTEAGTQFNFATDISFRRLLAQNAHWKDWFEEKGFYPTPRYYLLFTDPASDQPAVVQGTYTLRINGITFEENSDLDAEFVLLGQVYGAAGTDYMRRDLLVPLLWGMPFALIFGLLGACVATIFSMLLAATGAWFGGWVDRLIQWLVEANLVLPIIAISILIYSYFKTSIWTLLGIIVLLSVFGSPTKSFRSAFLQIKDAPYIEAAKAYGAGNARIIFRYLIPRILPIMIPQLVILIPSYVFLEATLGIFNVYSIYPTWGRVISEALKFGVNWGSPFWVLEPISLLLLTGLAFTMLGFALERILNPRLITK